MAKPHSRFRKIIGFLRSPSFIGLLLTTLLTLTARQYYRHRELNDADRKPNTLFDLIEIADLKSTDLRFKWRGPIPADERVVLLSIDDRSLEEVGRWPWPRERMAFILDELMKNGAKAIGMDVIWAEPEVDGRREFLSQLNKDIQKPSKDLQEWIHRQKEQMTGDQILGATIAKYKDHITLGTFGDANKAGSSETYQPYQDYCLNEAFHHINSEKFIGLNATVVVDDEADYFADLTFREALEPVAAAIESSIEKDMIENQFHLPSDAKLSENQRAQITYSQHNRIYDYCDRWLTPQDEFLISGGDLQKIYLNIFSKSPALKDLPFEQAVTKFKSLVPSHPIPQFQNWTINTPAIQEAATYTSSFIAEQDQDGSIRRAPLFFRTGNRIGTSFVPALALQTYLLGTGYQARINIDLDPLRQNQKILKNIQIYDQSSGEDKLVTEIPSDRQGRLRINYSGGTNSYTYLSARELFSDKNEIEITKAVIDDNHSQQIKLMKVNKADFIKDKIFIVGATAVGIYDLRVTPFEKGYPGPETHMTVIGNLLQKNFLYESQQEPTWMVLCLALGGLILSFALAELGASAGFVLTTVLLAGLVWFDAWLFRHGKVVTMVLPFFLVLNLYMVLTFYKYFTEERKKRALRATFAKYVSPAIVDEIMKDPENVELGGQKRVLTVFFSDLRNFTTISEKLDPQTLTAFLNRYLTPMTEVIFANKGTLDKYIGDAVMAFFGAPVVYPDHAACACRAALQSLMKLKEIQEEFAKENLPFVDIGIGINSREMSVGNMGSDIVRNYTVIGDAVNLGSRLEGLNKEYGTKIIISEFTLAEIGDKFVTRELDRVQVKGKKEPIAIFELIAEGEVSQEMSQFLSVFKAGYAAYRGRDFVTAETLFLQAKGLKPEDGPSQLYVERCEQFIAQPPPADWNGVYIFTKK